MASRIAHLGFSISELAAQLDRSGLVHLDNAISSEWLQAAQVAVKPYLGGNAKPTTTIYRPTDEQHAPAHRLATDRNVEGALQALTLARCSRGTEQTGIFSVLAS